MVYGDEEKKERIEKLDKMLADIRKKCLEAIEEDLIFKIIATIKHGG